MPNLEIKQVEVFSHKNTKL